MLHLKTSQPNFESQNRIPSYNPHMTAFSPQTISTTCGCPLGLGRFILSEYRGTQCEINTELFWLHFERCVVRAKILALPCVCLFLPEWHPWTDAVRDQKRSRWLVSLLISPPWNCRKIVLMYAQSLAAYPANNSRRQCRNQTKRAYWP